MELPTTRAPLSELPLVDYVRDPNIPLSPVSLPLKRPATPKAASLATPKRVQVELDADELGTGRSPARRLFDATPRASKPSRSAPARSAHGVNGPSAENAGAGGSARGSSFGGIAGGSSGGLAPSPPLPSRRGSDALPTPVSSASSASPVSSVSSASVSAAGSAASTPAAARIHDPGFVVFSDDDAAARPRPPAVYAAGADSGADAGADEENVPPEPEPEPERVELVDATPRRKRFEPSKLSTVTTNEEPISGKRGMIAEADLA